MKYIKCMGMVVISFCLMTFAFPAFAESTPVVLMIEVEGNSNVSSEKILGEISNTRMGEPLNSTAVQQDMQKIMATGYFSNIQVKTEAFFSGIKVVFVVIENPIFQELNVSGLTKLTPEEVQSQFRQKPGEVFNTVFFKEDLSQALKYFQTEKGLLIEPRPSTGSISENGVVSLELVELRLGEIKILGLEKTQDFVIRRELSLKKGDILDYNVIREEYMKLMRLRLFDNIDLRWEKSALPDAMDLVFNVTEGATGSFNIGVSYAQTTGDFGGLLTFSEGNLMGTGQSITVDLNIAEDENEIQFSFYEPWLNDKHTSFGLSLWNSNADTSTTLTAWGLKDKEKGEYKLYDVDLDRTGLSLSFGHPLTRNTTGRIKFNFEQNEIVNYWDYDSSSNHDDDPSHSFENFDRPNEFWNNSVELQLVKNRLSYQDRNFVDGGYQLSGSYEIAGNYLGGEYDYQTLTLEGKWFHAITPDLVFGTRLQGAYQNGESPDYDTLYLGGMNKLRGYHNRRFHDPDTRELIGTSYLLSNTELRYRLPMNKNFELVTFYDIGQVNNIYDDSVIKSDYGFGFRYNIPFLGMIRLDQAWNSDGESRLVISMQEIF